MQSIYTTISLPSKLPKGGDSTVVLVNPTLTSFLVKHRASAFGAATEPNGDLRPAAGGVKQEALCEGLMDVESGG